MSVIDETGGIASMRIEGRVVGSETLESDGNAAELHFRGRQPARAERSAGISIGAGRSV